jgi:hypothetical protein
MKKIKSRLNSGAGCYHAVQSLFSLADYLKMYRTACTCENGMQRIIFEPERREETGREVKTTQ